MIVASIAFLFLIKKPHLITKVGKKEECSVSIGEDELLAEFEVLETQRAIFDCLYHFLFVLEMPALLILHLALLLDLLPLCEIHIFLLVAYYFSCLQELIAELYLLLQALLVNVLQQNVIINVLGPLLPSLATCLLFRYLGRTAFVFFPFL